MYNNWFNDKVYIKSYQMEKLNIRSLKSYDEVLFKDVHSQADINEAKTIKQQYSRIWKPAERTIL